jgi:hypothetical protein
MMEKNQDLDWFFIKTRNWSSLEMGENQDLE